MSDNPVICACGCGREILRRPHHKYQPARFIRGHRLYLPHHGKSGQPRRVPPPGFVRTGLCECGCGRATAIAKSSKPEAGIYAGFPRRYIVGHAPRGRKGERAPRWKGGRYRNKRGYWLLFMPGHHLAMKNGYVLEHRLVWETANGRRLRIDEDVHHKDRDRGNNAPENLEAIQIREHYRLHAALTGLGRVLRCPHCRKPIFPEDDEPSVTAPQ